MSEFHAKKMKKASLGKSAGGPVPKILGALVGKSTAMCVLAIVNQRGFLHMFPKNDQNVKHRKETDHFLVFISIRTPSFVNTHCFLGVSDG